MTAEEYAESLPGEDLALEQPLNAKEYVEYALIEASHSSEEEETEEEKVIEQAFKQSFENVVKFVH